MTTGDIGYVLDANVLREAGAQGYLNVRTWLQSVPERALFISAVTVLEAQRGWEVRRRRGPDLAEARLAGLTALEEAYAGRIVPVDRDIVAEWARLLGEHDRNRDDTALAATARVRGLVVTTRNVRHFRGRGVRVLDPFSATPAVTEV
ncbi:MAG: PIN domain-containing protein [Janthinobacterium lividum]